MSYKSDISISIVSMNNLNILRNCLDSIIKYKNDLEYEVIVVAYKFSKENLELLRMSYPNIKIIVSNEIRGFSENYNLALKKSKSDFCLLLNDDTYFEDNSIKLMRDTFDDVKDASFVSPLILKPDGTIQGNLTPRNLIPRYTPLYWLLHETKLYKYFNRYKKYKNKWGINKTYNISGACFMVKTDVVRNLGYFDEYYFFTPEDIALSTKANKMGYHCYVNTNAKIYHLKSSTAKPIYQAILPVGKQGIYKFFGHEYNKLMEIIIRIFCLIIAIMKFTYWSIYSKNDNTKIMSNAYKNIIKYSFCNIKPKDLFIKLNRNN